MRIGIISTSYPQRPGDPSGHFVQASTTELARSGYDVHVFAPGATFRSTAAASGITVHWLGAGALFGWPGAIPRAQENPLRVLLAAPFCTRAVRAIRRFGPFDRLVAHWALPSAWPIGAFFSCPIDVYCHGADVRLLQKLPASARVRILSRILAQGASFTFAAESLRATLLAGVDDKALRHALESRARVQLPALELPRVAKRAEELRACVPKGQKLAVFAGRLIALKRAQDAVRAALEVPNLRLVVLGDGPERAPLERLIGSSTNVCLLGRVPRDEALSWIAAADVLVHASSVEAAPSAVREARALKTAVIAYASGDIERWAELDAGIRIVPDDWRALRTALAQVAMG